MVTDGKLSAADRAAQVFPTSRSRQGLSGTAAAGLHPPGRRGRTGSPRLTKDTIENSGLHISPPATNMAQTAAESAVPKDFAKDAQHRRSVGLTPSNPTPAILAMYGGKDFLGADSTPGQQRHDPIERSG